MRTATDRGSARITSAPQPQFRSRPGPDGRVPGPQVSPARRSRPSAWLGDGRGLNAAGAALLAFCLGLAGVGVDLATGTGLRTAFAVSFLLGCVLAAALVHHEDLMAILIMPPLLFVVLAAVGSVLEGGAFGSWLTQRTLDVVTAMVTDAPVLFFATGAVMVVVMLRFVLYRAAVRRRRALARPASTRRPAASA